LVQPNAENSAFSEGSRRLNMRSRKITNTGTLKNIGKFPSIKTGSTVYFESLLERDYIYLLDYDPDVIRFREQPLKIEYPFDGRVRSYFPDFLVEKRTHSELVEVKPQIKTLGPAFASFVKIITDTAVSRGYGYSVVTDLTIRKEPRLTNIKVLWRYARVPIVFRHTVLLHNLFKENKILSLGEITSYFASVGETRELVYSLLFHRHLSINIDEPMQEGSPVGAGAECGGGNYV
jgi:hypothetical protein